MGQNQTKLQEIEARLRQDPENARLWMEKGLAYVDLNMHYEAVNAYSTALTLDSGDPEIRMNRGRRYISLKRFPEALADLVLAAEQDPDSFDNWYYQGVAFALTGETERAVQALDNCLNVVLEQDASLVCPIVDWLWLLNMRIGRRERAAELLELVDENTPALEMAPSYKKIAMLYKGLADPETFVDESQLTDPNPRKILYYITEVFCLSNYYYLNGNSERSNQLLRQLQSVDKYRFAFAYMMAERDMEVRGLL